MSSNYETLYGVGLLDDLHNYFPALLYDSSSFGSVRDVFGYVQAQTRNRFDLFSYGLREYLSDHPPHVPAPVAPVASASASVYAPRNRTSFAGIPPPRGESRSTLPTPMIPSLSLRSLRENRMQGDTSLSTTGQMIGRPLGSTFQVDLTVSNENTEDEEEEEEETETTTLSENRLLTNILSLLQLPEMTLARNYRDITTRIHVVGNNTMDQFLQPVVIRPTPEQIEMNTSVGHLVSETDDSCAICQDSLTEDQDGRKLNACGHWFHKACIDTWLERDVHCPVCRHDIREPLQTSTQPQPPTQTQPPLPPV